MSCQRLARVVLFGIVPGLLCCLVLGCGGKGYQVSGKVTFKGQPLPAGKIYFTPDASKGNKGPTGYADIKDGKYDTAATGGSGIVGGPMLVRIEGIDPSQIEKADKAGETVAKVLFPPYQTAVDLPKENTMKDFDVPADALKPKSNAPTATDP